MARIPVDIMAVCAQTPERKTLRQRVDSKFEVDVASGCWLWTAGMAPNGYGRFHVSPRSTTAAQRAVYTAYVGPIPSGLTLDHLCRNPRCVNPSHLEAVPMRENVVRGTGPSAVNAAKTACVNGHPLSGPNLYVAANGARLCVDCRRVAARMYQRRRRAAVHAEQEAAAQKIAEEADRQYEETWAGFVNDVTGAV